MKTKLQPTLVYEASNKPVQVGDLATTFRGEKVEVVSFALPHKPSSSGKVCVRSMTRQAWTSEYFVSVIGAKWINRSDRPN